MNSVRPNINKYMNNDSQQYASNDSGLSCNSNGGAESDHKLNSSHDFQCDDLTKSLFINSFNGNEIIQDDDIYSYKSKMEFGNLFPNKFRSFNLKKSENLIFKNSGSFSSIIHDMENLKLSEQFVRSTPVSSGVTYKNDCSLTQCMTSKSLRIIDEVKSDIRCDSFEKIQKKRTTKKNNGNQEYVSSSIKDYQGDKALNDIVTFIQGTAAKSSKRGVNGRGKTVVIKMATPKDNECVKLVTDVVVTPDCGIFSDTSSGQVSQSNIDADSGGTHSSQFVSLNNSDEDTVQLFQEDFQQVLSKKQKKTNINQRLPPSPAITPSQSKSTASKKSFANKTKKCTKSKAKNLSNSILNSKDSFQHFLFDQYISFTKKFNTTS